MSVGTYRDVEGLYLCRVFQEKAIRSALSYEPQPNDVFIVSYPKCGTTWMQYIAYSIFNDGVCPQDMINFIKSAPFLEFLGAEGAKSMPRPGAIKTHLPFDKQPYSERAKYIYITRNPYDCCVSFYYHTKNFPAYQFDNGTFDEFFDLFVQGRVDYGDYFDHLLSWYAHREDPNVLFVTYEDLKKDSKSCILKVADFIGEDYGKRLRNQPAVLERIVSTTSLESMKSLNKGMKNWTKSLDDVDPQEVPGSLLLMKESLGDLWKKPVSGDFVRKGIIGDWKNHFSPKQVEQMKERIALKTKGSDVMTLWNDLDLP
ncbi:sulfotransferase ssu-1-like [Ixodes scapularis]